MINDKRMVIITNCCRNVPLGILRKSRHALHYRLIKFDENSEQTEQKWRAEKAVKKGLRALREQDFAELQKTRQE